MLSYTPAEAQQLPLYRVPGLFTSIDGLIAAESTRHGGVSPAPFAALNLGINTADDPANVDENRLRFFSAIGTTEFGFASAHQVHGTAVLHVTEAGRYEGYDALMTNVSDLLIGVTVADCVPILIYDSGQRAVAAVHAGWRGTVGRIVQETITQMQQQFGTQPADCHIYIGTCIDQHAFDIGPEVATQFDASLLGTNPQTGRTCADLKRANMNLCLAMGVPASQIEVSPFSTVANNDDYFSYRAEQGQTGRMLAVIGLKNT
ncbi:peptidoglycan editing factor PgeF [Spirosoma rhododendri]|uniref:Purine nucleoside phosphorylase n=1 Tax=Spirosoma rhododendri TaxID=2728024 RepID=A0A7L5DUI0_9BACT|nr:peptidoglycan editing factor PgeF [Spirosoma rhododendri]QJD80258.1 peptidoglycan editing factor PgeF [Spirosoma rhododendri]